MEVFYNKTQRLNYLRTIDVEVGFIFNFGPEPEANPAIGGEGKHLIIAEKRT
jgi:hypothetical protein